MILDFTYKLKEYKNPLIKFFTFLYQPYKWLIFVPFFILMNAFISIFIGLFSIFCPQKLDLLAIIWSRLSLYATPVFTNIRGRENIDKEQAYVIVANHASQYDIFVMYGWLGIPFKWVMKQELRKVPVIGWFCELAGHIFIDRSNSSESIERINGVRDHLLKTKTSILFFPEGTRSLTGKPGPFKKGAYIMAHEMGLPILPVTIKGTHSVLPAKTTNLLPGKAEIIIHKPMETKDYTIENLDLLIAKSKNIIEKEL